MLAPLAMFQNDLPLEEMEMQSTLMIVDDSAAIHELVKVSLADDGYRLLHAFDSASALAMARKQHPELILLDVGLPDANGFDLCAQLKANPATERIGVVFLTGSKSDDDRVRGLELEPIDYIVKPFHPRELSLRLRSAWRSVRMANQLADASSVWKATPRSTKSQGVPHLRFGQIIDARSKNPWHRVPPAQSAQFAQPE
jgi:DNA-binding response OmpR family regulator